MDSNRHVMDWVHAGNYHGVWGAGVMMIFATVATMAGFPVPFVHQPLILFPVAMALGFFGGRGVGRLVLNTSGDTAQQIYMPNASGSYAQTHSHIDALEAKGNYAGAADAWEKVAIAQPGNPWPLIRAGELYLRVLNEPGMALDRFKGAQSVPGIKPEHHIYVSQKIIDLYLGPLNDHGRALVELSRFVHVHAGTRDAAHAKEAIARIKAERPAE
jgi:hypothetical protein